MHSLTPSSFSSDVQDMQNFINISLATAAGDEEALTHDKLSYLRTVGGGFGALIYRLPSNAGYEMLVDRCKTLWDTLQSGIQMQDTVGHTAPNLPDMMVQCSSTCSVVCMLVMYVLLLCT